MLEDNPDDYIHDLFHRSIWEGHPLGMPIIGNAGSIERLNRECIVNYRNEQYRGGDIIISAAGKLEHDALVEMITQYFQHVPAGSGRQPSSPPDFRKRCHVTERELEQVLLCLGTKGVPQNDSLRYEAMILNTILGGSMSSRLFQEVREKEGLAYSIYSYLASHSDAGALVISSGTTSANVREVMAIILREIRKLKTEPITNDELFSAQEQLKGNLILSLENSDTVMSKLAKNELYLGCYQSLEQVIEGMGKVTPQTVQALCNEIFSEQYFTLQLLGDLGGTVFSAADIAL
jgi:predicted Zn-dependent peptidase